MTTFERSMGFQENDPLSVDDKDVPLFLIEDGAFAL